MVLRGSYASVVKRVDALEERAGRLRGRGCPTCRTWPDVAVCDLTGDARRADLVGTPDDGGDPLPAWPAGRRCPDCAREPRTVVEIRYAEPGEWPPGGPDTPARRPLPSPYAPDGRVYDSEP